MRTKAQWVYGETTRKTVLKAFLTDGSLSMLLYRFMQASQRIGLGVFAMLFNKLNVILCRCVIGRGAQFGPGFVLIHSMGVVINSKVRGGERILLEHGVTIGEEKGEAPLLGDDVFVGAGAKIIGGVTVGSRTKIGANAVVLKDVPDDSTAVGVPARVVAQDEAV
jgi:serine O-acetyltransferase